MLRLRGMMSKIGSNWGKSIKNKRIFCMAIRIKEYIFDILINVKKINLTIKMYGGRIWHIKQRRFGKREFPRRLFEFIKTS